MRDVSSGSTSKKDNFYCLFKHKNNPIVFKRGRVIPKAVGYSLESETTLY